MSSSGTEHLGRRRGDSQPEVGGAKLRILAVDDDASYRRYLKLVLERAGFFVEFVPDGHKAVDRLREACDVDLLLIDLAMPGLDGIDTVRRIQTECPAPELYTILLTADESTQTKLRALDSGFDDFLPKTSSDSEIVAKIRSAARRLELERRLHLQNEELQNLALTDELTRIANRRALFRAGDSMLASSRQLSVALFDLDRFKQINDTYGHLTGDRLLADVAAALKANTRIGDVIGRYGGDEFVLLLPDTGPDEAKQISERILDKIRQLTWTINGNSLSVGAQVGITTAARGTTLQEMIAACDQALYRRKRNADVQPQTRPEAR